MSQIKTRKAKSSISSTLFLMFSLVIFLGSMFWLLNEASFIMGTPDNGNLFKEVDSSANEMQISLNQTIAELQIRGYLVVYYMGDYEGNYSEIDYVSLINEASKVKIVYKAKDFDGDQVLLIEIDSEFYEWRPKS